MNSNQTALITGASAGLGGEFVEQLASRGYDVALTARSADAMRALAEEISGRHGVRATVHPQDLSQPGSADQLLEDLDAQDVKPDVLVNNAAFGLHGAFIDYDAAKLTAMLQLNMVTLAELTHRLGKRMFESRGGHILLVGSGAAFQPTPTMAGYGATKAFLLSLGEALNIELAPKVKVSVVSPGTMDTGFNTVSGFTPPPALERLTLPVSDVAKAGLDAMFAGTPNVVPGFGNKLGAFSSKILSRHAAAKMFMRMAAGD